MLSVSEVARGAGQSELLVRQHIHRGHLIATKDGNRTVIALDEALKWSRDRGFSFVPPPQLAETASLAPRSARMTVLARRDTDTGANNVCTVIRHRRSDSLGPWAAQSVGKWTVEELGKEFMRLTIDAPLDHCRQLADEAISHGSVNLAGLDCRFELLDAPRRHMAYRDMRPGVESSFTSPFSGHSAEVIEYWAADTEHRTAMLQAMNDLPYDFQLEAPSCLSLRTRPDRVGNLVIVGAQDTLTFDLQANRNGSLTFHASGDRLEHGRYMATVWACHGGDEILRRQHTVVPGLTAIPLTSAPDRIGFAVYRTSDGHCVDLLDCHLIVSVGLDFHVSSGPALQLTDHRNRPVHTVEKAASRSRLVIEGDRNAPDLDRAIRRRSLQRRSAERDAEARRAGDLARFDPPHVVDAIAHLTRLIRHDTDQSAPIYIADRYFAKPTKDSLGVLYADLFAASTDHRLNVLCTEPPSTYPNPWWKKFPRQLREHLTVRSFLRHDGKPAFHDRYLILGDSEILFTHSFNGWHEHGVTFVKLPFDVYRAHAVELWSVPLQSATASFRVEEYPR